MSDTEGMVRLMEHAADLLGKACGTLTGRRYDTVDRSTSDSVIAALAFGRATLQMVAASAAPENFAVAKRLREYGGWADGLDDAAPLTSAEIESVIRFLTGGA